MTKKTRGPLTREMDQLVTIIDYDEALTKRGRYLAAAPQTRRERRPRCA